MGNAGTRHTVIRDSSIPIEVFIHSERDEDIAMDAVNSTVSEIRFRRSNTMSFPLPQNLTVVDTNVYHNEILMTVLWYLLYFNLILAAFLTVQLGKSIIYIS